ncbi:subunit 17 of mediator complex-domain-containing protein [Pilobolus umbonatus]|nr:subunit 17 of mediator complex-domain-containing protein [Pilobolus umbonatus]
MSDGPHSKRLKLSLEPSINNIPVDITNEGNKIYKTEQTIPEKLMQSVDRIWYERGDWKDITEESLKLSSESNTRVQKENSRNNQQNTQPTYTQPGLDIIKLRESVVNKLFHAKSEIDVALDVINILSASNRSSITSKDLVLPPGSLNATYVTKPKATTKAQLESVQLNLGLKRKQQKQAADYLKTSAGTLKNLVEKAQVFWDEALDLRRNNWMLQANNHAGNTNAGSSFFVQYGYLDDGSDFNETSLAELKRSEDPDTSKLQLSIPHAHSRKVAVRISQSQMRLLGLGQKRTTEGILGVREEEDRSEHDHIPSYFQNMHSPIQNQLAEAHSTVFDAELFSIILNEAQGLNSNAHFTDDEVVVSLDGQMDLSILKIPEKETKTTTQSILNRSINLSFRLLLLQRYHYNIWKNRARILSSNYKIHQMLLQNESTVILSSAASTSANSTPNTAGTVNTIPASVSTATPTVRARTRVSSTHHLRHDLPKEIPILLPIMSITRFWVQFDRIRHVVHSKLSPFSGRGGLCFSLHFKFTDSLSSEHLTQSGSYDLYPGYTDIAITLGISVLKGPSLQFCLNQSGTISVRLPQTKVVLQNVAEFEVFLSREINVMCLRTACDVANDLIRRTDAYLAASVSDKQRFLWKVDEVDEAIHGSLWLGDKSEYKWRNINVCLKMCDEVTPYYTLQFQLESTADIPQSTQNIYFGKPHSDHSILSFKEQVCVVIKGIIIK